MITIAHREDLLLANSLTALFIGAEHQSDISLFWVDSPPGRGPEFHWHPYTETWVVLSGEAHIQTNDDELQASSGNIVTVPAETTHRFRSVGEENLRMLCIHASPTIIQEFVS